MRRIADFFLTLVLTAVYWAYSRTWRVARINAPHDVGDPNIYAHWHGDELLLVGSYTYSRMAVMASRSRDGDRMRRMLAWLGYRVVRGSSSRGGAGGLKGLIDAVNREGLNASLAVDGPRGPIYKVKPGILMLAQETGRPLIPGAAASNRRFVFKKAWNRCYLPTPFSKCVIIYGEPIRVSPSATAVELEQIRERLEQQLIELKASAESHFQRSSESVLRKEISIGV